MRSLHQTSSNTKRNMIISVIAILIIGLLAVAAYHLLKQKDEAYKKQQYGSSQTTPNKNTPIASNNGSTGGMASSKGASNTPAAAADPGITPTVPTGTFISNHHPNLSGQPAPNIESSTCTTTPGVACQIEFTNGHITKSLESQATNADGNTSWTWNLNDLGLTTGDWKVTAVATNGDKVTTADDSMLLSIKQ